MEILKIILLITFFAISAAIIILSFIIHKDSDDGTVDTASKTSFFGKNKGMDIEAKLDLTIKILFALFVINIIALYFVL